MMVIGIDMDGCLCSFNSAYIEILRELSGVYIPPESPTFPDVWAYDHHPGTTAEHRSAAWKFIRSNQEFWLNLQPYPETHEFLVWLRNRTQDDIYFITNRQGRQAKLQTERWLYRHGFHLNPTVLISAHKGAVCAALGINYYIDDCQDYLYYVLDESPRTIAYMRERPYNKVISRDVPRGDLQGFMALVEQGGQA